MLLTDMIIAMSIEKPNFICSTVHIVGGRVYHGGRVGPACTVTLLLCVLVKSVTVSVRVGASAVSHRAVSLT